MHTFKSMLVAVAAVATVIPVGLQPADARPMGINHRFLRQQNRIAQGIQSGQLTPRETRNLESGQARLRRNEYQDRHDGNGLQPSERLQLQHEQNRLSRHIYRQKHDGQTQPPIYSPVSSGATTSN